MYTAEPHATRAGSRRGKTRRRRRGGGQSKVGAGPARETGMAGASESAGEDGLVWFS